MFNSNDIKDLNKIREIFTQVKYDAEGNFLDLDNLEAALDKIPTSDYATKDISDLFKLCIDYEDRYNKYKESSLINNCYEDVVKQIDTYKKEANFINYNQEKIKEQSDIGKLIIDLSYKIEKLEAGVFD